MDRSWTTSVAVALALCVCGTLSNLLSPATAQDRAPRYDGYPYPYPQPYPGPLYEVHAQPENVSVQVLVEGRPAVVYRDAGYRWIEGRRGQRFALRITNHNSFPVGVIPWADGHSLTADGRAGASHPAYLLSPYGSITVSIWRQDLRGGRELVFTDVEQALAARKGDRRNIGVLGVLVWQLEDRERPVPLQRFGDRAGAAKAPGTSAATRANGFREDDGIGVGAGTRITDRAYITDRYRRVRVLGTVAIYYDDRAGLQRAGVDLNQYGRPYSEPYPHRRGAQPFPDGGYRGVRIPD